MYSQVLDSTHYFIPKSELVLPLEKLRDRFTVRSKFQNNEPILTFKETDKFFGVPRHYQNIGNISERIVDARSDGSPISFNVTSSMRDRQIPVYNEFTEAIRSGVTGVLVDAKTGTGKTFLGLKFIEFLGVTTLVVVPREAILEQWKERILQHTDIKESEIGIAQGATCDFEGKKIVIGMIHSLSKDKYPEKFLKYFGNVVFDEVHTVSAVTFSTVVTLFPSRYRIGLSATMKRSDGMEKVFQWSIGEKTLYMGGTTDVVPTVFIKQYKSSSKKPSHLQKITDVTRRCGVILSAIAGDMSRNQMIAMYAKKFAESGRKTVILSARKDQLKAVQTILTQKLGYPQANIGFFTQETKKAERQGVLDNSTIILATYGVMSMGIDVPDLRALIYGTPQSEAEQSIGRILRMCEGAKDPVALDIVDIDYKECQRWFVKRDSMYRKNKAKLVYLNGEVNG